MERNVPKLRFKGFCDEWKEKRIGEIADIVGGGTPSTGEKKYWDGNIQWFTPTEIKESKYVSSSIRTITEQGVKNSSAKILPKGTILLTTRATLGEMAILRNDATTNQGFQSLVVDGDNSNEFVYYLQGKIKKYCYKHASGSTFLEISKSNLEKFKVKIPSLEEQERIANFLAKVDKIIEKQDEKVKNLEKYKKGMMQKIFSQEIRFKDENGEEYPEWEEKYISEVATLISSKRVYLSDYCEEGIPFYRGKEVTELKNKRIPSDILYISSEKYREIKSKYGVPQKGDLLLTAVGTLGNSLVIEGEEPFYFKDGNLIWFKDLRINVNFLDFYINSSIGNKKILDSAIGSTQKALTIVNLNKIRLNVPCLYEQNRLVDFFNNIDKSLRKESEKLEQIKKWKKGLLQQMFV